MNKVIIIGNLGADPDFKVFDSGKCVTNLLVATEKRIKKNNEWSTQTEWYRVAVFGRTAENCHTYLRKGAKIAVSGSLTTDKYTDSSGVEKYTTKIIASEIEFLSKIQRSYEIQKDKAVAEAQILLDETGADYEEDDHPPF